MEVNELKVPWTLKITAKPTRFVIADSEGNEVAVVATSRSTDVRRAIVVGSLLAAAPELYEAAKGIMVDTEDADLMVEVTKAVALAEQGYGIANG
jgi:predicted methyltransferase MtxX (methanogen marker protein 4)